MEELSQSMSFKMKIIKKEKLYGNWDEKKQEWTGIVKHLHEKNVDFAVTDMIMSTRRSKVVDFTIPLITSRAILCFKEPNITSIQQLGYFKVRYFFKFFFFNYKFKTFFLITIFQF